MKFLNTDQCREFFPNKEVYIFGAGEFGEKLYNKICDVVNVKAFIDNNRHGKGNYLCGKEIISLARYEEIRTDSQPIIVSAYRHMRDISDQLEKEGMIFGKDFYVWDGMCIFHADKIINNYINFMKKIWGDKKQEMPERIILTHLILYSVHVHCQNE